MAIPAIGAPVTILASPQAQTPGARIPGRVASVSDPQTVVKNGRTFTNTSIGILALLKDPAGEKPDLYVQLQRGANFVYPRFSAVAGLDELDMDTLVEHAMQAQAARTNPAPVTVELASAD